MTTFYGREDITVIIDGQRMTADRWYLDHEVEQIVITSIGDPGRVLAPGRAKITIELTGVRPLGPAQPPVPREDLVTHKGASCCCRHCPEGNDHG